MAASPTPLSPLPFESQTLLLTTSTTVEADPAPYSNTKEIIILNQSEDDAIRFRVADVSAGAPLPSIGLDSVYLPPGGSITLAIGPEGYRNPMATSAFWATNNGSGLNLIFKAVTVTAPATFVRAIVTYVQGPGGGGAVSP